MFTLLRALFNFQFTLWFSCQGCMNYFLKEIVHSGARRDSIWITAEPRCSPSGHLRRSCRRWWRTDHGSRLLGPLVITNFRRLVLGCMDSYDSDQRRIFLHFSQSTRCASFCTVLSRKFCKFASKFCWFLLKFRNNSAKFCKNPGKSGNFREKIAKNLQNLSLERCKRMQIL